MKNKIFVLSSIKECISYFHNKKNIGGSYFALFYIEIKTKEKIGLIMKK